MYDFIKFKIEKDDFQLHEIFLLSGVASGQNENQLMVTFCNWLSMKLGVKVSYMFPITRHFFNQYNLNLGLCNTKLKTEEKIHILDKYVAILSGINSFPFIVKNGALIIKAWKNGFKAIMSKNFIDQKYAFKIQSYSRLCYAPTEVISVAECYIAPYLLFSYFKNNEIIMYLLEPT